MPKLTLVVIILFFSSQAHAYLGPGLGGGIITATIGIVVAILALILGIVWFPIKRFLIKKKVEKEQNKEKEEINKKKN